MANWWVNDTGVNTLKGEPQFETSDGEVFRNNIEAQHYSEYYGVAIFTWVDDLGNPGNWQTNPIHIRNVFMLDCIKTVPKARSDLFQILPSLLPAEQNRIQRVLENNPYVLTPTRIQQERDDIFMQRFNKSGVRTAGLRGG